MFRRTIPAVLAGASLLLTGCSSADSSQEEATASSKAKASSPALPPTSTSAAPSTAEATGPARSARGNIIKQLGEEGGFTASEAPDAPRVFTFAVDSITVDPQCSSDYASEPANGHYIAISLRASTSAEFDPSTYLTISQYDFQVIGPDGLTVNDVSGNAYSCLAPNEQFTSDPVGPGQQYVGTIVIDAPVTSGTLAFIPGALGAPTGWEWSF
ncbi:hypothetical protein ACI798_01370 [Geodermatophilus sp. SYSU D01045]